MVDELTVKENVSEKECLNKEQKEIDKVLDEVIDKVNKTFYQDGVDDIVDKLQIKINQ